MDNPSYWLNFESWLTDLGSSLLVIEIEDTRIRLLSSFSSLWTLVALLWNLSLLVGVISKFLRRFRAVCWLPTITCVFSNSLTYRSRHTGGVPNLLREMRYQHTLQRSHDNLKSGRPGIPQANVAAVVTQRSFHITVNSHRSLKQNRVAQELRIADSKDSPRNCLPKWTRPNT